MQAPYVGSVNKIVDGVNSNVYTVYYLAYSGSF